MHTDGSDEEDRFALFEETALGEVGETEEVKKKGLETIQKWISSQNCITIHTDENWLLGFLRSCKYDLEKTKKRIKCYYRLRASYPQWFEARDPSLPHIAALLRIGILLPLLRRDPSTGRIVIIIRASAHDPSSHTLDEVFKVSLMVLDLALSLWTPLVKCAAVTGVSAILDLEGVSLAHARQLSTPIIRRAVHSWQDCYPVRLKGLDFVNAPSYINVVLNIFRRFMNAKLRQRIRVHGYSLESLHRYIPPEILPREYGGTEGTVSCLQEHWRNQVVANQKWYLEDEKFRCNLEGD